VKLNVKDRREVDLFNANVNGLTYGDRRHMILKAALHRYHPVKDILGIRYVFSIDGQYYRLLRVMALLGYLDVKDGKYRTSAKGYAQLLAWEDAGRKHYVQTWMYEPVETVAGIRVPVKR